MLTQEMSECIPAPPRPRTRPSPRPLPPQSAPRLKYLVKRVTFYVFLKIGLCENSSSLCSNSNLSLNNKITLTENCSIIMVWISISQNAMFLSEPAAKLLCFKTWFDFVCVTIFCIISLSYNNITESFSDFEMSFKVALERLWICL